MMSDQMTETGRIEHDLEQTRSRLGNHLSELQDRLSPGQVLDDLMSYFRGSEGAAFGRSLMDNVRGNPMPAAITTIGLSWLMASNPRVGTAGASSSRPAWLPIYGHDDHAATITRLNSVPETLTRDAGEPDHAYSARLDTARGHAIGLARHTEESAESFGDRIRHAVAAIEDAVSGKVHDLRDQASNAASAAGGAVGSFGGSAQGAMQNAAAYASGALSSSGKSAGQAGGNLIAAITESPVLLGALGLAAGALLGALLPQSEQEENALGRIAGQARDAATSLAQQGLEQGKTVAQAVMDKGRASAGAHGLMGGKSAGQLVDAALSGDLAGNSKAVVQDVLKTGDEAVRGAVKSVGAEPEPAPVPGRTA